MKKFLFILLFAALNPTAFADGPGEFLQKSLLAGGLKFGGNSIKSVNVDCSLIQLQANNLQASIPVNSVSTLFYYNALGFACINGGGCIQTTDRAGLKTETNDITIFDFVGSGLKESISNAFKLYQKSCGGPFKSPY